MEVGSKKAIVEEFVTNCCLDGPSLLCMAFSAIVSIKGILLRISQKITGKLPEKKEKRWRALGKVRIYLEKICYIFLRSGDGRCFRFFDGQFYSV